MREIKYWNVPVYGTYNDLVSSIIPELKKKYSVTRDEDFDAVELSLASQLPYLLGVATGSIEGKVILDLGCGSKPLPQDSTFYRGRRFEPWLCRALHLMGAKPIGIDIRGLSGEEFENYGVNLLDENSLGFLPDNSVNIANASWLFDSKYLYSLQSSLKEQGRPEDRRDLKRHLLPQLERIVKHDGVFLCRD